MEGLINPVVIGVVAAPHGVRGTLKVRALGTGRHLRHDVEPVVKGKRYRILSVRETPKGFLVDLEGIGTRTLAASLRGSQLLLDRKELDVPEAGEFYVEDLMGLGAYDSEGTHIGRVADILDTPTHEILVVRDDVDKEHYVPFTFEHVPAVDLKVGRIVVNPPETLS